MDYNVEQVEKGAVRSLTIKIFDNMKVKAVQRYNFSVSKWGTPKIQWSNGGMMSIEFTMEFAEALKYLCEAVEVWRKPQDAPQPVKTRSTASEDDFADSTDSESFDKTLKEVKEIQNAEWRKR